METKIPHISTSVKSNWAKKQHCNYFNTCGCRYGDKCWFDHSINPSSVNHALLTQLIKVNNTVLQQQKSIAQLHKNQITHVQQLKETFLTVLQQHSKDIREQHKKQMNTMKGLLNKEFAQLKQNQNKQQKTLQSYKDNMSHIKIKLQSIEQLETTMTNSLKQLKRTMNGNAEHVKDTMGNIQTKLTSIDEHHVTMENKITQLQDTLDIAREDIDNTSKQIHSELLNCSKNRKQQVVMKDMAMQSENVYVDKAQQTQHDQIHIQQPKQTQVDLLSCLKNNTDIAEYLENYKCNELFDLVIQPTNYECRIVDIINEKYQGYEGGIQAQVDCNGEVSTMVILNSGFDVENGCVLINRDGCYHDFQLKKFNDDEHVFIEICEDMEDDSDTESENKTQKTEINDTTATKSDKAISTEPMKRPCHFLYNTGWCKFQDKDCKFSHAFQSESFEN
eukprot:50364_1